MRVLYGVSYKQAPLEVLKRDLGLFEGMWQAGAPMQGVIKLYEDEIRRRKNEPVIASPSPSIILSEAKKGDVDDG